MRSYILDFAVQGHQGRLVEKFWIFSTRPPGVKFYKAPRGDIWEILDFQYKAARGDVSTRPPRGDIFRNSGFHYRATN